MTLLWYLTTEGKRVSIGRVYRFINQDKVPNSDEVHLGDYVVMQFQGGTWIVQIISFKFFSGKRYHGDVYKLNNLNSTEKVAALCTFFHYTSQTKVITLSRRPQRYIDMENFESLVAVKRDIATGTLT